MKSVNIRILGIAILALALFLSACASQPAAKPAEPAKPAEQAAKPTAAPAAKPAEQAAKPTAAPVAKPAEQAAKPTAAPAAKPDAAIEAFYKGKTVTLIVGLGAGGGYDLYARLLSRHLGRHIPGNPTVIVQNMPGAGSVLAANHLYNAAAKDGTVLGSYMPLNNVAQLVGGKGIQFDAAKFNWIGTMSQIIGVCVARADDPVQNIEDVKKTKLVMGATGVGSNTIVYPALMNETIGTKFEWVPGYPGQNDIAVAIERNEVQGACGVDWSWLQATKQSWIKDKFVNVLVLTAMRPHPSVKNVPLMIDFAKDDKTRGVYEAALGPLLMGRPFAAPPGVPAERVEALRKAFMDTMNDPKLIEEATASKMELGAVDGKEVQAIVERSMKLPKEQIEVLKKVMEAK